MGFKMGCAVLVAFSATEPALSGAEGAGTLTSYPTQLHPRSTARVRPPVAVEVLDDQGTRILSGGNLHPVIECPNHF
jgi:hypothetical protein